MPLFAAIRRLPPPADCRHADAVLPLMLLFTLPRCYARCFMLPCVAAVMSRIRIYAYADDAIRRYALR